MDSCDRQGMRTQLRGRADRPSRLLGPAAHRNVRSRGRFRAAHPRNVRSVLGREGQLEPSVSRHPALGDAASTRPLLTDPPGRRPSVDSVTSSRTTFGHCRPSLWAPTSNSVSRRAPHLAPTTANIERWPSSPPYAVTAPRSAATFSGPSGRKPVKAVKVVFLRQSRDAQAARTW